MKYCEDMCQIFRGITFLLKLMGELLDGITQERHLCRRFCAQVYGGQCYTRIPRHIVRREMHVSELANHHEGMSCHFIMKYL